MSKFTTLFYIENNIMNESHKKWLSGMKGSLVNSKNVEHVAERVS